jgi:molybdenum cofactor guanylyltransferase
MLEIDPKELPGAILAGGRSSRMGRNKGLVTIGGESLLTRITARLAPQVADLFLNADLDWPEPSGLRIVPDTLPDKAGPLAGILAVLRAAAAEHPRSTHVLIVPIDCPFLPPDLAERMAMSLDDAKQTAIAASDGRDHPVVGLWPVAVADDLESWIARDEKRRVRDFLAGHAVVEVEFEMIETRRGRLDPFFNINRPEDLAEAEQWLKVLCP